MRIRVVGAVAALMLGLGCRDAFGPSTLLDLRVAWVPDSSAVLGHSGYSGFGSSLRTAVKKARAASTSGTEDQAAVLVEAHAELDRAAKKGVIEVTIDTTSIRTHDSRVDAIVKGPSYFNVEKYPTMTFKSTRLDFDGDRLVGAEGELTMIGVTRPVTLKVVNFACGENPFSKKPMCGGDATASIKRSEWGMTAGIPNSSSDDVRIVIPIEAYRDDAG